MCRAASTRAPPTRPARPGGDHAGATRRRVRRTRFSRAATRACGLLSEGRQRVEPSTRPVGLRGDLGVLAPARAACPSPRAGRARGRACRRPSAAFGPRRPPAAWRARSREIPRSIAAQRQGAGRWPPSDGHQRIGLPRMEEFISRYMLIESRLSQLGASNCPNSKGSRGRWGKRRDQRVGALHPEVQRLRLGIGGLPRSSPSAPYCSSSSETSPRLSACTIACARLSTFSFASTWVTWVLTVSSETDERRAMSQFDSPSAELAQDLGLSRGQRLRGGDAGVRSDRLMGSM